MHPKEAKEKHKDDLRSRRNVVSVGVGRKEVGGVQTDEDCVVVGVREKVPEDELDVDDVVPRELDGCRTDVVEVGELQALPLLEPKEPLDESRTGRHRPVPCGVSIAHMDVTAGTSSYHAESGVRLSNNHVIANVNQGEEGDSIVQPGPHDGGEELDDFAGELKGYVPIEDGTTVDVAWLEPSVGFVNELLGVGRPSGEIYDPEVGDELVKSGRTTGVTRGTVQQVHVTVDVNYGPGIGVITLEDQLVTSKMMEGGDSGSAVVYEDEVNLRPAALGFAGSDRVSVLNYAGNVESESGLSIKADPGEPLRGRFVEVPGEVQQGDSVEIDVEVTTTGEASIAEGFTIRLVNGVKKIVAIDQINDIDPGEWVSKTFSGTIPQVSDGDYRFTLNDNDGTELASSDVRVGAGGGGGDGDLVSEFEVVLEPRTGGGGNRYPLIRGQVWEMRDGERRASETARVEISGPETHERLTNSDGMVSFEGVTAGSYQYTVMKQGFETASGDVPPFESR